MSLRSFQQQCTIAASLAGMEECMLDCLKEMARHPDLYDGRAVLIAREHIETAHMWAKRAVFKLDPAKVKESK